MTLAGKTLLITGASRGIGLAIGRRAAREGANVAVLAKTVEPHPKLPGTIFTAAASIEAVGGQALPLAVDIRDADALQAAIAQAAMHFGSIDIVVNNASAIHLAPLAETAVKRIDLMFAINVRGTLLTSKFALPYLRESKTPHILMLAPPLDMRPKWFAGSTPYSIAKFGMGMTVLGLAEEVRAHGIAVNALWPRTTIATAAIENLLGGEAIVRASRTPEILADAAVEIFKTPASELTGRFLIDDTFLFERGVRDFDRYRVDSTQALMPDFFVPDDSLPPVPLGPAAPTPR